ncbi:MAG: DUF2961 domain-containing protein [Armatimonadaceae bacterium]
MENPNDLYRLPDGVETRWASPENPRGERGRAAQTNGGRKGRPCLSLAAGEAVILAEEPAGVRGTVRRIWLTVDDRSPKMLRGLKLEAFWDGAERPAIAAPLGDFFGVGLGQCVAFESVFFSNPEGRSFNCCLPMPFQNGMRLVLTNETDTDLTFLFYDVNYSVGDAHGAETLYLHAHFRRENPTTLQQDYPLLPTVFGRGRFLGVNIGVRADQERYGRSWWGEGEVKIYRDDDDEYPTLCGTGTEDYIGTAWGQGAFAHRYQGCPVADYEQMQYCFYRYHVPDPVFFEEKCRVTIQQIGGAGGTDKKYLRERSAVSGDVIYSNGPGRIPADLSEPDNRFVLFEREDDWSSCAYFYLNRPENDLPSLSPVEERIAGL